MRLPGVAYWPPWHGQEKPVGLACTGHPRCMQVFEIAVNLLLPSLRI